MFQSFVWPMGQTMGSFRILYLVHIFSYLPYLVKFWRFFFFFFFLVWGVTCVPFENFWQCLIGFWIMSSCCVGYKNHNSVTISVISPYLVINFLSYCKLNTFGLCNWLIEMRYSRPSQPIRVMSSQGLFRWYFDSGKLKKENWRPSSLACHWGEIDKLWP